MKIKALHKTKRMLENENAALRKENNDLKITVQEGSALVASLEQSLIEKEKALSVHRTMRETTARSTQHLLDIANGKAIAMGHEVFRMGQCMERVYTFAHATLASMKCDDIYNQAPVDVKFPEVAAIAKVIDAELMLCQKAAHAAHLAREARPLRSAPRAPRHNV